MSSFFFLFCKRSETSYLLGVGSEAYLCFGVRSGVGSEVPSFFVRALTCGLSRERCRLSAPAELCRGDHCRTGARGPDLRPLFAAFFPPLACREGISFPSPPSPKQRGRSNGAAAPNGAATAHPTPRAHPIFRRAMGPPVSARLSNGRPAGPVCIKDRTATPCRHSIVKL